MLVHARMKRAALAVALVTASTGVAAAGGYIGIGIGPAASIATTGGTDLATSSELPDAAGDGRSARLIGGYRFGRISVEAAAGRFGVFMPYTPNGQTFTATQLQLSGKYNHPIGNDFELFGRLGMQKMSFDNDGTRSDFNVEGSGVVVGAGVDYHLSVGIAGADVFLEYQYARADVSGDRLDWGATHVGMWTLGATISF
jgi:hypothetical protein